MPKPEPRYWKAYCDEVDHPGLWKRWYLNQCVAVGWPPPRYSYRDDRAGGPGWKYVKNRLGEMQRGDHVIVALRGHCIGRLGVITGKRVEDAEWDHLVPPADDHKNGEVGRRIEVRWDLTSGPPDADDVVQLPKSAQLSGGKIRRTIAELDAKQFRRIRDAVRDETNWVSLQTRFVHETALSDYIAEFPHRLEDGLLPHPSKKVREMHFRGAGRTDVILIDRDGRTAVVECKQGEPTESHARQLLGYVKSLRKIESGPIRAILVHGGATKLPRELHPWRRRVEFVQYRLSVGFSACR